ncbi:DUF1592 domain-containing protein [Sphingomonas solaris]|uniref:DUF1592 domain-containing protein n=1 Tax=Alterirhizorhabdus solaris TaxID=2529389 RepID=A0A558R914_9SPHN|nr:DUF1592 domain-containing protein [Sphingomonas solaris]TVV75828.1 DUF1592 domain-containing protein [Sphingomonas solaris]
MMAALGGLLFGCAADKAKVGAAAGPARTAVAEPAVPPAAPTMRLMTQSQYANTIADIFGTDIVAKVRFAPVNRTSGLVAIGAAKAGLTPGVLDPLDATARSMARQILDTRHRDIFVPCRPVDAATRDDACATAFLAGAGRRLYRRPMTQAELAGAVGQAGQAAERSGDFYAGLAFSLGGMLVSPQFLFITETAERSPGPTGVWGLDGYSKASRLSFLLWDSAPDEDLLKTAERGGLESPAALRRQVSRMMASPRFERGLRAFFSDYLDLESFDTLSKDGEIYPAFSIKVAQEAREQVLRTVVDHLIVRKGDYRDLFTTKHTFMSSDLGVIYNVPVNRGSQGWQPYDFGADDPRGGLLTSVAFLAQHSHPGRSSPTRRGRAMREILLCQNVPDPPPDVDFSTFEEPSAKMMTARERLSAHATVPTCRGCHALTDPMGLALENFDGAGQWRKAEHGMSIDPSGSLNKVAFKDPAGLGRAVRDEPALRTCIVNRLYGYSTGRAPTPGDAPLLKYLQSELDRRGYRIEDMLGSIILSRSYFAVAPADRPAVVAINSRGTGNSHAARN